MPSPVPDNVRNPALYRSIKEEIRRKLQPGQRWGAHHSGRLVQTYKMRGGTYSGTKPAASNLRRWYHEKWIDVCYWPQRKACSSNQKGFPYCRPSARVSSRTPTTVQELTPAQRKERCRRKKERHRSDARQAAARPSSPQKPSKRRTSSSRKTTTRRSARKKLIF